MSAIEASLEYALTEEQIAAYRRDGFIALQDVVPGGDLQELRDAVAEAVAGEMDLGVMAERQSQEQKAALSSYSQLFIQKVNLWRRWPKVAKYVNWSKFGNIAARLEGLDMRVWHDQALFKEPRTGVKTPWHQDAVYWPHAQRAQQTTIWIALKDATIQNGCMSFVGGTHKIGPLPAVNLGNPQDIFEHAPHIKPVKPVTCPLKAGSVTFHNGLTFHYAGPNKSDGMREAFAIIYMPDGTTYDGKGHVVTDPLKPGLNVGDPLAGEMFPLVGRTTA
jgi:ectoine hydroxylase-related dioxygenase (phytanoyl-CoA dioxygenase family)